MAGALSDAWALGAEALRAAARWAWPPPPAPPPRGEGGGASHREDPQWAEPPGAEAPPPALARFSVALAPPRRGELVGPLQVTAAVGRLRCRLGGRGHDRLLREVLRLLAAMTRALGRGLLGLSALLRRLLLEAPPTAPSSPWGR